MDTKLVQPAAGRRRRRHEPEFKARIVAACLHPGVSIAAVALANGINTNLLRRWVKEHRETLLANPGSRSDRALSHEPITVVVSTWGSQALALRQVLERRFAECKLELHPQKTKIAYCKDANRRGHYSVQRFDFLGYSFRPRRSCNRAGKLFVSFSPAVSDKAAKAMRETIRRWHLHHRGDLGLDDLVRWTRSVIHGWHRGARAGYVDCRAWKVTPARGVAVAQLPA